MKRIVITGGPCSGKSTVIRTLREEFGSSIVLVPEVATILLGNGFPVPGSDVDWSEEWQAAFQAAVLPLQERIEDAFDLVARSSGATVSVCDRGLLDGAAYTPGGLNAFAETYGVQIDIALGRYAAVIHLESVATAEPKKYGKVGNESRFETLERAVELEYATQAVWGSHERHIVVSGKRGIEGKISEVMGIVRFLIAEKV